jgi:hypothetical protein
MTRPIEIYQGQDDEITVLTGTTDLTTATEIDFRIDTYPQVVKTLSAGQITALTATQFLVTIDAADLASVEAGNYKYQCRATLAGKIRQGKFTPNKIIVRDSVFETQGQGNDYNS